MEKSGNSVQLMRHCPNWWSRRGGDDVFYTIDGINNKIYRLNVGTKAVSTIEPNR